MPKRNQVANIMTQVEEVVQEGTLIVGSSGRFVRRGRVAPLPPLPPYSGTLIDTTNLYLNFVFLIEDNSLR